MKFITSFAALLCLAAAAPEAPTPLDVKLEMAGNSAVKATITNNGKENLKVFKTGTILDKAAIQKAHVIGPDGNKVQFQGIRQRISTENLDDSAFEHIPAGKSVEVVFNVGQVHDLSSGGTFNIHSRGVLQFANQHDNQVVGSVAYTSNNVSASVDGAQAASVLKTSLGARKDKRSIVQSDCTNFKRNVANRALFNCARVAALSRAAAQMNNAKVREYFKDGSLNTKNIVASVFNRVAVECAAGKRGASRFFCTDIEGGCSAGVLAYSVPDDNYQVYCDSFFRTLPSLSRRCHALDQATTTIHEMTHLADVANTEDLAYGYRNIMRLDTEDSLNNAENYALFANSIIAQC
ncbi:hypothetical protein E4U41_004059 [Claviceps citrina]|nr:hypothetical protein E4U41_004059 [Claviceps citrina]